MGTFSITVFINQYARKLTESNWRSLLCTRVRGHSLHYVTDTIVFRMQQNTFRTTKIMF